jgi:hypothetical protein
MNRKAPKSGELVPGMGAVFSSDMTSKLEEMVDSCGRAVVVEGVEESPVPVVGVVVVSEAFFLRRPGRCSSDLELSF